MENPIDKLFQDKLGNRSFDFQEAYWQQAQQLIRQKRRRRIWIWSASIFLLSFMVGSGFWWFYLPSENNLMDNSSYSISETDRNYQIFDSSGNSVAEVDASIVGGFELDEKKEHPLNSKIQKEREPITSPNRSLNAEEAKKNGFTNDNEKQANDINVSIEDEKNKTDQEIKDLAKSTMTNGAEGADNALVTNTDGNEVTQTGELTNDGKTDGPSQNGQKDNSFPIDIDSMSINEQMNAIEPTIGSLSEKDTMKALDPIAQNASKKEENLEQSSSPSNILPLVSENYLIFSPFEFPDYTHEMDNYDPITPVRSSKWHFGLTSFAALASLEDINPNWGAGIFVSYDLLPMLSLAAEPSYFRQVSGFTNSQTLQQKEYGFGVKETNYSIETRQLDYVQLPLLMSGKWKKNHLELGLLNRYLVQAKTILEQLQSEDFGVATIVNQQEGALPAEEINRFQQALFFGYRYDLLPQLSLGVRATQNFKSPFATPESSVFEEATYEKWQWSLHVFYKWK